MNITNVELSGYKSIKNINLDLKNINVLIGANGSGKSNFISFFKMLSFYLNSTNGLIEFVNRQGGANSLLHYGSKTTNDIKAKITFETESGTNTYSVELDRTIGDELYFKAESVCFSYRENKYNETPGIPLGSGGKSSKLLTIAADNPDFARYIKTITIFRNMMSKWQIYQFHDTSATSYIRSIRSANDYSYLRSDGGNLSAILYMLKNNYPERFDSIQKYLRFIAPYVEEILPEDDYNSQNIKLRWREKGNDAYHLDVGQMSDGTLRALALITLIEQPWLPEVICIDEPELGLHPEAIKLLGDLIASVSDRAQIIVSTQSPVLLDCFDADDIVVCGRKDGQTTLERLDKQRYETWLNDYTLSEVWETNIFGGKP
jgi:predicted ATPase